MKNTFIVFNGGSYGTFIEWILNYFSDSEFPRDFPFTESGSSHKFVGNNNLNMSGCIQYVESNKNYSFVRVHPKTDKFSNIIDSLEYINQNFKKVIYLTPTVDSIAWNINNKLEKNYSEGWLTYFEDLVLTNIKKWGNYQNINDLEMWELREFLSLFIYDQHCAETELSNVSMFTEKFSKMFVMPIDDLRDNFKDSIILLLEYCEINPIDIDKISEIHSAWIPRQYHMYKDTIIKNIIDNTLNQREYDWSEHQLTLVDESLIQYYLRKQGIQLKCYELNKFPNNTKLLEKYFEYATQ